MKKLLKPFLSLFSPKEQKPAIPFQPDWIPVLEENFPLYHRLPAELREALHEKTALFISSKHFEGCNGFELTDEVIVLVSAQACLLILNQDGDPYPNLRSVLIYPTTFKSVQKTANAFGVVSEEIVSRLGESWDNGTVVLAWDSVKNGARTYNDGHNVSMHEFAHQIDQKDGSSDGVPLTGLSRNELKVWCSVMENSYQNFLKLVEKRRKTVIDKYGATNRAEFYAVTTETFFEKPKQLKNKWPELYDLMNEFYGLDPISWGNETSK